MQLHGFDARDSLPREPQSTEQTDCVLHQLQVDVQHVGHLQTMHSIHRVILCRFLREDTHTHTPSEKGMGKDRAIE